MKSLIILSIILLFTFNILSQKPELVVQTGHSGKVTSVSVSLDGKYLVSGSDDNTLKLWDINAGKEIRSFLGHRYSVNTVSFSPDGKYVLSGSSGGALKLWDVKSGEELKTFIVGNFKEINSVSFSPDGKYAISGASDSTLRLWDISTGKEIRTFRGHNGYVSSVAYSPDGKYALSGSGDSTLRLWDISTGKEIKVFAGHRSKVTSVSFSPNGKYVLSGSYDNTLKLWDIGSGKEIRVFMSRGIIVNSICFSPDGKYVLSAISDSVRIYDLFYFKEDSLQHKLPKNYTALELWDINTGNEVRIFKKHSFSDENSVCFTPDGKYAISGSEDGAINQWDINLGEKSTTFAGISHQMIKASISNDEKYVFLCNSEGTLVQWGIKTGTGIIKRLNVDNDIRCISFTADAKYAVLVEFWGNIKKVEIKTGKVIKNISKTDLFTHTFCLSPDGKYALSGSYDDTINVWDINKGKRVRTLVSNGYINSINFSPNGKYAISGDSEGKLKLWDVNKGKEIRTFSGHSYSINSVCFSPDGKYVLSGSNDWSLKLWNVNTGEEIKTFDEHLGAVNSVCFSPNGHYIMSGSDDNTLKLWDLNSGKEIKTFIGANSPINYVCFSPNGNFALSISTDNRVKLWGINSGKELATFIVIDSANWAIITPEGFFDASSEGMRSLHWVQGYEIFPLESFYTQFYTPHLLTRVINGEKLQNKNPNLDFSKKINSPLPTAEIVSPPNGSTCVSRDIKMKAYITDQGGRIKEIKCYHNGSPVKIDIDYVSLKYQIVTCNIHLQPDTNELKIIATNNDNIESIPAYINVYFNIPKPQSDLYILSIGIDNYENPSYKLPFCKSDAESFTKLMVNNTSDIYKETIDRTICNKKAVKKEIISAFNNIITKAKPEDYFIFFYSGHGAVKSDKNNDSLIFYYLVLQDVLNIYSDNSDVVEKGISTKELIDILNNIKAQKKVVIFDACYSGEFLEYFSLLTKGADDELALKELSRSTGVAVLASTGKYENTSFLSELGHSIYTYVLLKSMKCDSYDNKTPKRLLYISDINSYISHNINYYTEKYKTSPQYPVIFNYGNDLPIMMCGK
jgi:WD40 repeat protein